MRKIATTLVFVIVAAWAHGQQLPHFSQFFLNDFIFNPAIAGAHDEWRANMNQRYQWVGVTDAPRTFTLSGYGPMANQNMGIGGYVFSDVTGPTRRTGFKGSYGYHLKLNDEIKLGFGLAIGLLQYTMDGSQISLVDGNDVALSNSIQTAYSPDGAAGIYLYSKKFFVSLSAPQLLGLKVKFFDTNTNTLSRLKNHYFINGGYTFDLDNDFQIQPFVQGKYVSPLSPQVDVGLRGIYQEKYWLGATWRSQDAVNIMAGIHFLDNFQFAYSYDITTNGLQTSSSGTHEVYLGFRFNERQ